MSTRATIKECCGVGLDEPHKEECGASGVDPTKTSESMKRDPERWTDAYVINNSENLRKRAIAVNNGKGGYVHSE